MKTLIRSCFTFLIFSLIACKETEAGSTQTEPVEVSNTSLNRVEPPNWWIGMKDNSLQLLVNHPDIGTTTPEINYAGITVKKVHKAKSPNYLFIDLEISQNTKAGKFDIVFKSDSQEAQKHTYELKSRVKSPEDYVGFNSSDAIYLITPDRFVNANPDNDSFDYLNEKTIDRSHDYARHGGDIEGITNNLDYISDLGFTAIWPMPLIINDMYESSYHGYAMTDLYKIDPRFGTLEEYLELSSKAKEKGIKLIMDQIANHCGLQHWWMRDLPFDDWVNNQADFEKLPAPVNEMRKPNGEYDWDKLNQYFTNSNHRRTTNQDLYASTYDRKGNNEGWFVPFMPDLNQKNPFMAKYLIQNSIWWIETAQLEGIRQDTYPYPDKHFMSDWAGAIMNEYPNFNIVGEEWSYNPLLIAYWQDGKENKEGYKSNLKSTMDFAMQRNIVEALNENESWDKGLVKLYEGLANDFAYHSPENIMTFPDNHDMSRIFTQLKGDIPNTKMALATHIMMPRILQMYYGTEILMNDFEKPGDHGLIRTDFPGGWLDDSVNAFTGEGLTEDQTDMQSFLRKMLNYRKNSKAIQEGKTVHFSPFLGTYLLFRTYKDETVVMILNKSNEPLTIDLKRYTEMGLDGKTLRNVISGESFVWDNSITFDQRGVTILTTKTN